MNETETEKNKVDAAPSSNLPTWRDSMIRVQNRIYIKVNGLENDDFLNDEETMSNVLHEFIYEYDCTDEYKSAWWRHRLEKLVKAIKENPDQF